MSAPAIIKIPINMLNGCRIKIIFLLIFIGIEIFIVSDASAATFCEKDKDEWCPYSVGPITTWTAPLCEKARLIFQPLFFYNRTRGIFNEDGHYKAYKNDEKKSQWQEMLFLQYGLTDKLEIAGQGVYQQNIVRRDGDNGYASGFGDTYIFARYRLCEETKFIPYLIALFQLKMPTGKYQKASANEAGADLMGATTGGGSYDHGYGINLTKKIKPFIFHADFIYSFPLLARVDGVKTKYADYVNCDLGVECFLPKGFNLMVEVNGLYRGDRKEDSNYIPSSDVKRLNLCVGAGWSCEKIQTLLAYQRTLAGTNVDVDDSIIFTFSHTF